MLASGLRHSGGVLGRLHAWTKPGLSPRQVARCSCIERFILCAHLRAERKTRLWRLLLGVYAQMFEQNIEHALLGKVTYDEAFVFELQNPIANTYTLPVTYTSQNEKKIRGPLTTLTPALARKCANSPTLRASAMRHAYADEHRFVHRLASSCRA